MRVVDWGAKRIAERLKALAAFSKNTSSGPRMQVGGLTISPGYSRHDTLFSLPRVPTHRRMAYTHTDIHINISKINKIK